MLLVIFLKEKEAIKPLFLLNIFFNYTFSSRFDVSDGL
jgi:hypothetical protein